MYPLLIAGSPISTVEFWNTIDVEGIMFNAYDIMKHKKIYARILNGESIRDILKIPETIPIWIDSGGYQIMKKNINISLERLIEIYKLLDADYYISLDFPTLPGEDSYQRYKKITKTLKNFDILVSKIEDKKIVPVIHFSTNLTDIDRYLEVYIDEFSSDIIAFGGFVPPMMGVGGLKGSRVKSLLLLIYLRKRLNDVWIHVMGAGSASVISMLKLLKIESTDSSAWRVKASYGKIIMPWGGERHVTNTKSRFGGRRINNRELHEIYTLVKSGAFPIHFENPNELLHFLSESFENRALFNLWIVMRYSKTMIPRSPLFKRLYVLTQYSLSLSVQEVLELIEKTDRSEPKLNEIILDIEEKRFAQKVLIKR